MTTGQLIKAARKRAGMTQSELAQKLNIPFQSVSQWERDLRKPKIDTLNRIGAALDEAPWELIGDELTIEIPAGESFTASLGGRVQATTRARISAALDQMTPSGQEKVAAYAEDILPQHRRTEPTTTHKSTPEPPEGQSTTPPLDAPERPTEEE